MELLVKVVTEDNVTKDEAERLQANIWALLNEVRPDLVAQGIQVPIHQVDVTTRKGTGGLSNGVN